MTGEPQLFKYHGAQFEKGIGIVRLCRTDIVDGTIQIFKEGGEINLHGHTGQEAFWMVLEGQVRFYGEGDRVLGELSKYEGILIPRSFKYRFERISAEPLQILRVAALTKNDERLGPMPESLTLEYFDGKK